MQNTVNKLDKIPLE